MSRVDAPSIALSNWNRWRFYDIRQQAGAAECYWPRGNSIVRRSMHAGCCSTRSGTAFRSIWLLLTGFWEIAAISGDLDAAEEQLQLSIEPFGKTPAPLAGMEMPRRLVASAGWETSGGGA